MASALQKTDTGVRDIFPMFSSDKLDDRLNKLFHVPIHNLVSTVLSFRMFLDKEKFENGEVNYASPHLRGTSKSRHVNPHQARLFFKQLLV
jgi:hypothetical protein